MACSLRYYRFWSLRSLTYYLSTEAIVFYLFLAAAILPVLQHMYWRSGPEPYVRELREASRFRGELLSVLRHDESAASGIVSTSTGADASWSRVDARQVNVKLPLPLLVPGETVGFRWRDTPPDVSDEGTLAGPGSLELWLGRVVSESDWEAFCEAVGQLLRRQWKPAAVTVVSGESDDALLRRIWLAKVVEAASGREMVQAFAVTTAYEGIPLFFFAQREIRGDAVTAEAVVTESLYSQMDAALPYGRLEQMEMDVVFALAVNNPLLLCALLFGWFFAKEPGFAVLGAAWLSTVSTLGFRVAELLGVPISLNIVKLFEFSLINALLAVGVALVGVVVGCLCRGKQIEWDVRQAENDVIQRLGDRLDLSKKEEALLKLARSRMQRCFSHLLMAVIWLAAFAWGFIVLSAQYGDDTYNGTQQVVARLEQMSPAS